MSVSPFYHESTYSEFLRRKTHEGAEHGFDPVFMPDDLFDFQAAMVEWSVRKGRAALFEDCGLGKTIQQLVWAENIVRKTNGSVLILTPLAVSSQTVREAEKFGIECSRSSDGVANAKITVTNYERLHLFSAADFTAVVCDESSILKSFSGARRQEITDFMRKVPYRLLATATAAPNDYIELGTSSEALGYLGHMDMLNRFFKNENNNSGLRRHYGEAPKWRLKGHAEMAFWRFVTSWARAIRKPSDIGFDDGEFKLPDLIETEHLVESSTLPDGMLFALPAMDLQSQREERRRTLTERCERVASLVADTGKPAIVWCHLNDEGNLLSRLIDGAIQVSGSDRDESKEERLTGFADGDFRVLVTKPRIGAWGLNFQHCAHMTFFPSHSYEQFYQSERRCWRFGQQHDVNVDIVMTEGDRAVMKNLRRKADAATEMFGNLIAQMGNALAIDGSSRFETQERIPSWL